ncbi:MAG: hypothetical protein ACSLE4_06220 [Methyloceanibacter sp.]|uniref:hypothetical protein n=1 Tax=Methyloceanibacter sp. TaxID=1965321 RepID=UPI003EE13249
MFRTRTLAASAVALSFVLAASAVAAQKPTAQNQAQTRSADQADQLLSQAQPTAVPPPVNDGEAYHRADDAQQDPAELRTTQALNDEITSRNALAENQERSDRAKYEEVVTASTQAQLAYEEDVRRSEAAQSDWQAEQARWQAERARWEADVRACNAGDRTRCAAPQRY